MSGSLGGGSTHLLRMARTGCKSAVSFVALVAGDHVATAIYPIASDEAPFGEEVVDDLVRQLWLDPAIARRKALLRSVRVGGHQPGEAPIQLAVATVPVGADGEGRPWGLLGVADPDVKAFGLPDVELLSRIAQRLTSYVAARRQVRSVAAGTTPPPAGSSPPPAGSSPPPAGTAPVPEARTADLASTPGLAGLFGGEDPGTGLLPLGTLLGRTGRLLGAGEGAGGSLAVVALEVSGASGTPKDTMARVARAIRADLRFEDLVSGLGATGFIAVVPLAPGGTGAQALADRLAASARAAVGTTGAAVRSAHVAVDLSSHADAADLVRAVLDELGTT
ncbi:MAG: hypothetical protein M0010_16375 [Actinomycetota bacterium]|nr:hypothetical protein [Actinomycetota bacterium]